MLPSIAIVLAVLTVRAAAEATTAAPLSGGSAAGPNSQRQHGAGPIHLPLNRHGRRKDHRDDTEPRTWLQDEALRLRSKYAQQLDAKGQRRLRRDLDRRRLTEDRLTTWQRDTIYTTQLQVGTPPQSLEVHLDTGSADMYLFSECTSPGCSNATQYDRHASKTFKPVGTRKELVQYGKGYAEGYWVEDTVVLVGDEVPGQRFLGAIATDSSYTGTNVSGLVGLAWPSLASGDAMPLWVTLAESWEDKRFSFFLDRVDVAQEERRGARPYDSGSFAGGMVTFGGVDARLYTGDIHYIELTAHDYWRVYMDHLSINGHVIATGSQYSAVVDTGSTLLSGPPALVEQFYARIPGAIKSTEPEEQGFWHVPCTANVSLKLELGGKYFSIAPEDIVYSPAKDGLCVGSLVAADLGNVHWVVGDTFLKNVYTVFRYEPPAVGFATLRERAPYRPGLPDVVKA